MLDAISDFWKPTRKQGAESHFDASQLQVGATIGFGFVPQITAIENANTAVDRIMPVLGAFLVKRKA